MSGVVHRARWVLTMVGAPIPDGEVAVADGVVVAVGRNLATTPALQGFRNTDHDGVLMPGLVNAHTHLVYGPAFADLATAGLPFHEWIVQLLPRRLEMTDEEHREQTLASARMALEAGTTAVGDIVVDGVLLGLDTGLGGVRYLELAGRDPARWAERRGPWEADLAAAPDAGISPHTLYTLDDEVVRELATIARRQGRRLHPHLAETAAESEFVLAGTGPYVGVSERFGLTMALARRGSGRTPVAHLDALGGLGPDVHVAHGVHVDATDRQVLRHRRTAVALCTRSNATLGAGRAPVAAYRAEGNAVAVGTDSLASSPDLDLLAELRALEALAREQGSPDDGLDEWLTRAATTGGADALGIDAGRLVPGARADLVVVQGEGTDPYAQVVHGRATATYLRGVRR